MQLPRPVEVHGLGRPTESIAYGLRVATVKTVQD